MISILKIEHGHASHATNGSTGDLRHKEVSVRINNLGYIQRHIDSGGKSDASPMRQDLIFRYIFHTILQNYRI